MSEEIKYILTPVEKYNYFISQCKIVSSFLPCSSISFENTKTIFTSGIINPIHPAGNFFIENHASYLTCVTFDKKIKCERQHVCNLFPVMIGTELDKEICEFFFKKTILSYELDGMYIIDGAVTVIPNLITNRKEMGHKKKNCNEIFCLYVYDLNARGFKISMDKEHALIFRNSNGENVNSFDRNSNFFVNMRHLDFSNISKSFERLYNFSINIDSLENKVIYSPTIIFHLLLSMAQRKPDEACENIARGQIEKFASSNIAYSETNKPKFFGDKSGSFNYRKLQPNQLKREGIHSIVIRPMPKNVSRSIIQDTEYFMCLVEKSVSLDSFNRTMQLLDHVVISDLSHRMLYGTLDMIFDLLLKKKFVFKRNTKKIIEPNEILVLANGGLLTLYNVSTKIELFELFTFTKMINPFVEIIIKNDFVMFNQTPGIPFTPLGFMGKILFVSPIELNYYFKHLKKEGFGKLFGSNCDLKISKMAQYANFTKLMVGVNFHKNRLSSSDCSNLFTFTSENWCAYINKSDGLFDKKTDTMKLNTFFSSHPQLTADGYIFNKNNKLETEIIQRSRFEMEVTSNTNVYFFKLNSCQCIKDYDKLGNVIKKIICVGRFDCIGVAPLTIRIFPQTKFFLSHRLRKNGHSYLLFKFFDDKENLESDFAITSYSTLKKEKQKKKIFFDIIITCHQKCFDGLKLSDLCSQKGLTVEQNVSRYKKSLGVEPDVISSIFSIVNRTPYIQTKLIKKNCLPIKGNILYGKYQFDALKNAAFTFKSYAPLKIDLYSAKIFLTNNLQVTLYNLLQKSYKKHEQKKFLPEENRNALALVNCLKVGILFRDKFKNSFFLLDINRFETNSKKRKIEM